MRASSFVTISFALLSFVGIAIPSITFAATQDVELPRVGCATDVNGAPVAGAVAQASEYGPILRGVCQICVREGNCTLTDFMIATGNIGNYALGLIGSIALLLFVIGGIYWILAAGREDWVKKGAGFLKAAVIGIAIAFAAQLLLQTVKNALISGSTGSVDVTEPVDCTLSSDYTACGRNSVCFDRQCLSFCQLQQIQATLSNTTTSVEEPAFRCINANQVRTAPTCFENYCPNPSDLCCDLVPVE